MNYILVSGIMKSCSQIAENKAEVLDLFLYLEDSLLQSHSEHPKRCRLSMNSRAAICGTDFHSVGVASVILN